jgi:hypothetical protein
VVTSWCAQTQPAPRELAVAIVEAAGGGDSSGELPAWLDGPKRRRLESVISLQLRAEAAPPPPLANWLPDKFAHAGGQQRQLRDMRGGGDDKFGRCFTHIPSQWKQTTFPCLSYPQHVFTVMFYLPWAGHWSPSPGRFNKKLFFTWFFFYPDVSFSFPLRHAFIISNIIM